MYTRAPQFQHLSANRFERREIKQLFTVVSKISLGSISRLHPIGPDQHTGRNIAHHQVVADPVESVSIQSGALRRRKSFAKFAIEDLKSKALAFRLGRQRFAPE